MTDTPGNSMPAQNPPPLPPPGDWVRSPSETNLNLTAPRPAEFCPPRLFMIIAAAALITGIAVNFLLGDAEGIGFNISLVALTFFAGWYISANHTAVPLWRKLCALAAVIYAFVIAFRASEILFTLNLLLTLGFTGLACSPAYTNRLKQPLATFVEGAQVVANIFLGWIFFLLEFPWSYFRTSKLANGVTGRIFTGVLVSIPFLFIFGLLFAKAEAGFSAIFENFYETIAASFTNFWITFWAAVIATGLLRSAFLTQSASEVSQTPNKKPFFNLGMIESATVLILLNALFLLFVITQLPYMFGGQDRVSSTPNLAWSEYARRGFFELAWVAALLIPTLMLFINTTRTDTPRQRNIIISLGFGLTALGTLVIVSALQRMLLYTANFGLTELRIYVSTFIVMIAIILVLINVLNVTRRPHLFMPVTLATGIIFSIAIQIPNIQAMIAKDVIHRQLTGKKGDIKYLKTLSADAVPTIVNSALPPDQKRDIVRKIIPSARNYNWLEHPLSTRKAQAATRKLPQ